MAKTNHSTGDLDALANWMLVRHLQVSWPEPTESMPTWFGGKTPPGYTENLRTVAVVGAGASYPMESIADDCATELEKELDGDSHDREVELDRLENVYSLDRNNFETRLTAICRTPEAERKVRDRISENYRHRHPSLLTYELLAHLLHHRFLDAIISFNFDELLDQAVDDELGPNEFRRVVTERDCDPGVPTPPAPLYIKMHGTASEPDSLRFTRERYYWTPKSIIELVEKQFEVEHLVVMNVGCRMSSFDFQYLLRKPDQLRIYHLDPYRLTTAVTKEITKQRRKARERLERVQRPEIYDEPAVADFSSPHRTKDEEFLPNLLTDLVKALRERAARTRTRDHRLALDPASPGCRRNPRELPDRHHRPKRQLSEEEDDPRVRLRRGSRQGCPLDRLDGRLTAASATTTSTAAKQGIGPTAGRKLCGGRWAGGEPGS